MKRTLGIAGVSRRWKLGVVAALFMVASASAAAIALASGGNGSGFTSLGPFVGTDINVPGSCGNTYAIQNFQTSYRVYPQKAGGSYVVKQDSLARGQTEAGSSLEACATGSGATAGAGIPVTTDYIAETVISGGTFNPSGRCSSPCFFAEFVPAFFGPSASAHEVSSINTYDSPCNGSAIDGFGAVVDGDITGNKSNCGG
jgi:hypothetical protein